jgi:hypothetical protein
MNEKDERADQADPCIGPNLLIDALAKASALFGPIERNKVANVRSEKGSYSYSYASLDAIIAATKPHLAANGLVIVQSLVPPEQGKVGIETTMWHRSGQSLSFGVVFMPVAGATPQALGGAITYARRYALCAALNIAAEDDDDAGSGPTTDRPAKVPQAAPPPAAAKRPPAPSAAPAPPAAPAKEGPPKAPADGGAKRHSDVFRASEELGVPREELYAYITKRFGRRLTELSADECAKAVAELTSGAWRG